MFHEIIIRQHIEGGETHVLSIYSRVGELHIHTIQRIQVALPRREELVFGASLTTSLRHAASRSPKQTNLGIIALFTSSNSFWQRSILKARQRGPALMPQNNSSRRPRYERATTKRIAPH